MSFEHRRSHDQSCTPRTDKILSKIFEGDLTNIEVLEFEGDKNLLACIRILSIFYCPKEPIDLASKNNEQKDEKAPEVNKNYKEQVVSPESEEKNVKCSHELEPNPQSDENTKQKDEKTEKSSEEKNKDNNKDESGAKKGTKHDPSEEQNSSESHDDDAASEENVGQMSQLLGNKTSKKLKRFVKDIQGINYTNVYEKLEEVLDKLKVSKIYKYYQPQLCYYSARLFLLILVLRLDGYGSKDELLKKAHVLLRQAVTAGGLSDVFYYECALYYGLTSFLLQTSFNTYFAEITNYDVPVAVSDMFMLKKISPYYEDFSDLITQEMVRRKVSDLSRICTRMTLNGFMTQFPFIEKKDLDKYLKQYDNLVFNDSEVAFSHVSVKDDIMAKVEALSGGKL